MDIKIKRIGMIILLLIPLTVQAVWLDMTHYTQEKSNWCWAATCQGILEYYGVDKTQTQIAYWANGGKNDPTDLYAYNRDSQSIKHILEHFGDIDSEGGNVYYYYWAIKDHIDSERPYVARWGWDGTDLGHFLTIMGYNDDDNDQDIWYFNPSSSLCLADYDWFVQADGHTWTHTLKVNSYPPEDPDEKSITVTRPSEAGISWKTGSIHYISWTSTGDMSSVVIELKKKVNDISSIVENIAITENDGSYIWTIPDDIETGNRYYIKIWYALDNSVYDISDNYFTINQVSQTDDPYEPNNTRSQAKNIALNGSPAIWTSGTGPEIDSETDQDWFKFSATAGDQLVINCDVTSELDAEIVLYQNDTYIAKEDAHAAGADETLTHTISTTGAYYVGIGYYDSIAKINTLAANSGSYKLSITLTTPDNGDQYEPNDSRDQAWWLPLEGAYPIWFSNEFTAIEPVGDVDWFALYASKGETILVDCSSSSELDPAIVLYRNEECLEFKDDFFNSDPETIYFDVDQSDTYYIGIGYFTDLMKRNELLLEGTGKYSLMIMILNKDQVNSDSDNIPDSYQLYQNYPNPFNGTTKISFDIPAKTSIRLTVHDVLGRELYVLANGEYEPGSYHVDWQYDNLPTGVYFYRIVAPDYMATKKMLLQK